MAENSSDLMSTRYDTVPTFNYPEKRNLWKTLWEKGKRGKCWYPAFSLFPTMFSTNSKKEIMFLSYIYFVVCKCFEFGSV